MAEIWGAAIAGVAAVGSAAYSAHQAGRAADASAAGSAQSIAEQRRQFDLTRQDTAPYRAIGSQALGALGNIYGYSATPPAVGDTTTPANAFARPGGNGVDPSSGFRLGPGGSIQQVIPGGTPGNALAPAGATAIGPPMPAGPDYSNFFASPDYQFRREQGTQGIERTASARGLTGSGNALAALADYNSNLASGEFGNYFNRQATLAGIGQSAVNTSTGAGMNSANNISGALTDAANARASGITDAANAWGTAAGTIGGIVYDRWGRKKPQPVGGTTSGSYPVWGS